MRVVRVATASLLLIAACGGDESQPSGTTPAPTSTTAPSTTTAPPETATLPIPLEDLILDEDRAPAGTEFVPRLSGVLQPGDLPEGALRELLEAIDADHRLAVFATPGTLGDGQGTDVGDRIVVSAAARFASEAEAQAAMALAEPIIEEERAAGDLGLFDGGDEAVTANLTGDTLLIVWRTGPVIQVLAAHGGYDITGATELASAIMGGSQ